jgi:glutamine---fructose-6-phosphate transaminase (isomerizing)
MCGIAGFLSNEEWKVDIELEWIEEIHSSILSILNENKDLAELRDPVNRLIVEFDQLMRFSFHFRLFSDSTFFTLVENLAISMQRAVSLISNEPVSEANETLRQELLDFIWQIRAEILDNVIRTNHLIDPHIETTKVNRSHLFVAWSIEKILENIDRLEVRGRDSAGISIQCLVDRDAFFAASIQSGPEWALENHSRIENGVKIGYRGTDLHSGGLVATFIYKVANLVGHLGDNTRLLRSAVRNDRELWKMAGFTQKINIIAHTRWASNGIISLANCHPVDGELFENEDIESICDKQCQFVLNGDVDNYHDLVENSVHARGFRIDPSVTTDAKILPVFYRLGTSLAHSAVRRFAQLMNGCEGSLAIVMQNPLSPDELIMGQKGSGQSLFVGTPTDGFILASEVYGLAAWTRSCLALSGLERGGSEVTLSTSNGELASYFLEDGATYDIKKEPIYIHSRDIFRGDFAYYFEKEIHEAPLSISKTIKGKYVKEGKIIRFEDAGTSTFAPLLQRLRDSSQTPVRRITVIGQGTAAIAAKGVAYLISKALEGKNLPVTSCAASELSGFLPEQPLNDMLLIAISQSGTTTDTNRTVDIASSQGAWVHAIVNRRNSPLVAKSDSHFYTSDGRDVEMAVASTKAFYSQITAGKLTAILLGREFGNISDEQLYEEILSLEELPGLIESVLKKGQAIKLLAECYGPGSRNWAVVGNGPNKIAADEIRIKLSELCYKSIPCDITEDKKHIDLSTEPLTLVIANDLPDQIVQDTAKEVAIFKAHSGKPLVFCSEGEKRFDDHAESILELPVAGGGLGFVLATVAGHLWGFYSAKAIDIQASGLRDVRSTLTMFLENPQAWDRLQLQNTLNLTVKSIADGEMNASLPASTAAALALYSGKLALSAETSEDRELLVKEGIVILSKAIEEMTRPIDSIRHQAKTVTVGISRPQEALPSLLLKAMEILGVNPGWITEQDKRVIKVVAQVIHDVKGGMLYSVGAALKPSLITRDFFPIHVVARFGFSEGKQSRYDQPSPAGGSKRTALRLRRAIWSSGKGGKESLLVLPLFNDDSGECHNLALFHVDFVEEATISQKTNILRALGSRFHDVVEKLQEQNSSCSMEDFIARVTPRELVLSPIESLILSMSC